MEAKVAGRDNTSLASLAISFIVFVAVPYELYVMGLPLLTDFAITVFVAGFVADIFTTRIGFRRGYGDYNILYNVAQKSSRSKNNAFLGSVIIFGAIRALIAIYFWNEPIVLIIIATTSLIGPLWNSIILSAPDRKDLNIPQQIVT
ncbi:MAG: hypothetical protein ACYC7D_11660 [Nitrososphaerales archaeon]